MNRLLMTLLVVVPMMLVHAQNVHISGGAIFEGEPFIAQNPSNPDHLVVAWMGFKLGDKVVIKTRVSFDGGQSWSAFTHLPHVVADHNSADPSLAFNSTGDVYVCYVDYDNIDFLTGSIVVAKSSNGGLNWSAPVIASDISFCPNKLCVDRPWMVVDCSGGAFDGTIYVTSMNANQPMVIAPYHPYFSVSSDGGDTFQFLGEMDDVGYLSGSLLNQPMPTPAVGSDGVFHAIYPSYMLSQSVFAQNFRASSNDGGVSFNYAVVNSVTQGFSETQTKKGYVLKAHPSDPNRMAFFYPSEQAGDLDIFMMETLDGGAIWSAAIRVNDDPVGNGVLQDLVWADYNEEGDVVVCWRDRRNGGVGFSVPSDIYAAVKLNGQPNFLPNFPISDQTVNHNAVLANSGNDFLSVCFHGDTAHVVWGDTRSGVINIFYNKTSVTSPTTSIQSIETADWRFNWLYPNPAVDYIVIPDFSDFQYEVYSAQGERMLNGKIAKTGTIDVINLSPGMYFITIKDAQRESGYRFLKQ